MFPNTQPVVVGASLGGYMALKYAAQHSTRGLLLIAPVNSSEEHLTKAYTTFHMPVHIIFGTRDKIVALDEMKRLTDKLPNAKLIQYEKANHTAYLKFPDRFKKDLRAGVTINISIIRDIVPESDREQVLGELIEDLEYIEMMEGKFPGKLILTHKGYHFLMKIKIP